MSVLFICCFRWDLSKIKVAYDFRETDSYLQRAVVVAEYAEILKDSYWAEESSLDQVYKETERISEYLYHDEYMNEFVELVREARRLK